MHKILRERCMIFPCAMKRQKPFSAICYEVQFSSSICLYLQSTRRESYLNQHYLTCFSNSLEGFRIGRLRNSEDNKFGAIGPRGPFHLNIPRRILYFFLSSFLRVGTKKTEILIPSWSHPKIGRDGMGSKFKNTGTVPSRPIRVTT